jgi:hypothetical protein
MSYSIFAFAPSMICFSDSSIPAQIRADSLKTLEPALESE